jgi:hypothetical protein
MPVRKSKNISKSRGKRSRKTRMQRGGVANACVLDVAMNGRSQGMCGAIYTILTLKLV